MNQEKIYSCENVNSNMILIVDDDEINRKILKKIFYDIYSVKEVENGHMGLAEILSNRNICAVLLDVVMPEMDGIEVLRHLKRMGLINKVPIFLITGEREESVVKEAYQLGVMDVIVKPVIPYQVRRRVQSVVELFETRKRLHHVVETQEAELSKQAEKIIRLNRGMIEALATAIEFRNEESGGHVSRIGEITRVILKNTEFGDGLDEEEVNNIAQASLMHDVGKIAIPDAILTKPGKFTPEEYEIMKTHTTEGMELLKRIPQLRESGIYDYACDIAWHHHERWDGRGYPEGLCGDEISPWAQVVSLADVYDALSCKRVYKAAFSRKKVLEMIWAGECGVFNPRLLDSFFSIEEQISRLYEGLPDAQVE